MSGRDSAQHRKSDVGMQMQHHTKTDESVSRKQRRQTIAEVTRKENPDENSAVPRAAAAGAVVAASASRTTTPSKRQQQQHQQQPNNKHAPLNLGSATSYYFKGAPMTPVQKLVRSEQKKMLLEASTATKRNSIHANEGDEKAADDLALNPDCAVNVNAENTGNTCISLNQSYLSSSSGSSSGGRNTNSSREDGDDIMLNTSVLSDTTELTASNYVALAATQRTTAELELQFKKATSEHAPVEQRRQPLGALMQTAQDDDDHGSFERHKSGTRRSRRQTLAPGMLLPKPKDAVVAVAQQQQRRRETFAATSAPAARASLGNSTAARGALSPANLGALVQTMKDQRLQRERSKELHVQEVQQRSRLSIGGDSSSSSSRPTGARRLSIAASTAASEADNTSEASISVAAMQALLNISVHGNGSNQHINDGNAADAASAVFNQDDSITMNSFRRSADDETVTLGDLLDDVMSVVNGPPVAPEDDDDSRAASATMTSPLSNKHQQHSTAATFHEFDSPARNTRRSRSSDKKKSTAEDTNKERSLRSPAHSITRTSATKSSAQRIAAGRDDVTDDAYVSYLDAQSPARNTRSSSAKKMATTPDNNNDNMDDETSLRSVNSSARRRRTRSATKKSPAGRVNNKNSNDDSAAMENNSLGDRVLFPLSPAKNTRSVTTQKLMQSPSTKDDTTGSLGDILDDITASSTDNNEKSYKSVDSPARNTRSAGKKSLAARTDMDVGDDTTMSLGDIWGGMLRPVYTSAADLSTKVSNDAASPARNTRSAQKKLSDTASGNPEAHNDDGTGQSFLSLSASGTKPPAAHSATQRSKTNSSTTPSEGNLSTISISSILKARSLRRKSVGSSVGGGDDSTVAIGDLLDDLIAVGDTATDHGDDSLNSSPVSNIQISAEILSMHATENAYSPRDSTVSLGDLLDEYLPKGHEDEVELHQSSQQSLASTSGSTDSLAPRSAVSKASTIGTPVDMRCGSIQPDDASVADAQHSPPSTISFPTAMDESAPYLNEEVSEFLSNSGAKSPFRKPITSSKLAPSPRRLILSNSYKGSPYKKALTPTRLQPSPMRMANLVGTRIDPSSLRKVMAPTNLQPSPLRPRNPKRRIDDGEDNSFEERAEEPASALKRRRTFEELQGLVDESPAVELTAELPPDQRNASLHSVLRRPGSAKIRTSSRRVAFGSPTVAEFNKTSPSMRLTPMPKVRMSSAVDLPDDTAEIEDDMQALFKASEVNLREAGSTPFATRSDARMNDSTVELEESVQQVLENEDGSDMSIDSATAVPTYMEQEDTVALECNMSELLGDALGGRSSVNFKSPLSANDKAKESSERSSHYSVENTMELETNINTLLNELPVSANKATQSSERSLQFDDENTMELETDINDLLHIEGDTVASVASLRRRSSISSRRFSIAPSGRLSLSADGSFHEDDFGDMKRRNTVNLSRAESANAEVAEEEPVDLKVGEILIAPTLETVYAKDVTDFLSNVSDVLRDNGVPEPMNALISQVYHMVVNQTDPQVELGGLVNVTIDNLDRCRALQRSVRSSENQVVFNEIRNMAESLHESDTFEWLMWLVSAAEQLERPLDEKRDLAADELRRLDELCYDVEQCLASMNNKAVRKARQKSMNHRKVRQWIDLSANDRLIRLV